MFLENKLHIVKITFRGSVLKIVINLLSEIFFGFLGCGRFVSRIIKFLYKIFKCSLMKIRLLYKISKDFSSKWFDFNV